MTEGSVSQSNGKSVKGITSILDALLLKGKVAQDQIQNIKFESINTGTSIESLLKEKGVVSSEDIARTYSEMRGIGYIDLANVFIPPETLKILPPEVAKTNMAVPFESQKNKLKVAMEDPLDLQKIKFIETLAKKRVEAYYASVDTILNIIDTKYSAEIGSEVDEALEEVGELGLPLSGDTNLPSNQSLETAPIIKIVNMILEYGIKNGASDIHIEPRDSQVVVRFRVRGVLQEKLTIPKTLLSALVTRIKILSNLKIDEHRVPQDNRFQVNTGAGRTDIRVSIMPAVYGEKIVMRLQSTSKGILDLEKTGLRGSAYSRFKSNLAKTQGIILVTGPTGSGKTQTLASSLKILNTSEVNIVTLEDPVEIKVEGVNQVQVNSEVGLTFASGLRAILRQDPDIIMVGEIRDSETASLAVQSALVGRLVLATLHTNSAAGAFIRLIDMGIEPFLLSSTVNLIEAQRLVRVLCDDCKEPYQPDASVVGKFHEELDPLGGISIKDDSGKERIRFDKNTEKITLYKPIGCPQCNQSGYKSRTGIFECLVTSEKINKLVLNKSSIADIHKQAVAEGMITMTQDGMIKALEGITSLEEIMRVRNE